jgi:large subunit ribosomal protein L25
MRDSGPQLAAQNRTVLGKKVRFLRRRGITPANVFGHAIASTAIQLSTREIEHVLAHVPRNSLLSLNIEGSETATVLVKSVTRKPTTGELYHIDFHHVSMTEKLRATVPLFLTGTAPAVDTFAATVLQAMESLPVECLPGDLPTQIRVDLTRLAEVDDSIFVRDLDLPRGVTALVGEDELVVKALAPTVQAEEAPEEGAAGEAPAAAAGERAEAASDDGGTADR